MRSVIGGVSLALAASLLPLVPAQAQTAPSATQVPANFTEVNDFTGTLLGPTSVTWAPDGRRFVAEKNGRVRVVTSAGTLVGPPLLDIRHKVNNNTDRGLLGIATDKDFATNGYLYILYTYELHPETPDSDLPMVSRLTRVTVKADNTLENPTDPETVILGSYVSGPCPPADNNVDCIPADAKFHTIGTLRVDPVDGTLWLGNGDATTTSVQEQAFRTYDNQSFAGKIIHIDRNGRGLPNHPFCSANSDLDDVCTKLYAKGFRNPFRFSLRTGKGPIVGDVGNALREELDLVKPGRNYGWPCYEGDQRMPGYSTSSRCMQEYAKEGTADEHTGPNWSYAREGGASIIGGPAIDNDSYPQSYQGDIMVGDFVKGWIKRLEFDADGNLLDIHSFATSWGGGVDLLLAPNGDLSYVDIGWDSDPFDGAVRRFTYASGDEPPVPIAKASPTSGPAPLTVQFNGDDSFDPEGQDLTFRWAFGDGTTSTEANPSHVYTTPKTYQATLTVDDGSGRNPTDSVSITVNGDPPPEATIGAPSHNSLYIDGTTVELEGAATDTPDGNLTGDSLEWQVLLHHNTHIHQIGTFSGATASFTTADNHDADSYYEIRLTATDSAGQSDTETINILPQTSALTLASSPSGAPISYDSEPFQPAPFVKQAAAGFKASIAAASSFVKNDTTYTFTGWSDGGARQHTVTVPTQAHTLTATYEAESGAPVNTSPPTISGTTTVGHELTAQPGTWSGVTPLNYEYEWRRCPSYADTVTGDAPIAQWRLGESGGTAAADSSGHARDGSYVGGPSLGEPGAITGEADTSVGFVDTGDRMTVSDDPDIRLNGSFSIEFWAKLNSYANTYPGFMRKGPSGSGGTGYVIFYNSDLRPNFKRAGIQKKASADAALSTSAFKHYVVTYDSSGQTLKWYVDGALDKTYTSVVLPESVDPSSLHVGRGDHYGNHVLDEVALYDSPLAGGRVAAHYNAGREGCDPIAGATASTYTPVGEDEGARLKVKVTATNSVGSAASSSAATAQITVDAGTPPTNLTPPAIEGSARQGETLLADPGTWAGTAPLSYDYTWKRCPTYAPSVKADAPVAYWRLGESSGTSANDASGNGRSGTYVKGPSLGQDGALTGDPNTAVGFVAGGHRVQVDDASALRLNGSFSIEFWGKLNSFANRYPGLIRKGVSSSSGTGYVIFYNSDLRPNLKRAGIQKKVSAAGALSTDKFKHYVVTYDEPTQTLKWYVGGTLDSTFTSVNLPDSVDPSSLDIGRGDHYGNHVLDEVAVYASPLSAGRVAAHHAAGKQACSEIADATGTTYTPSAIDVGARIKVKVTASNEAGVASAESSPSAVVKAPDELSAPALRTLPKIEGDAVRGSTLTARRGKWKGTPPITYSYDWKRCRWSKTKSRRVCSNIKSADQKKYTPRKRDIGYRLKVKVAAANLMGTRKAASKPTKKVRR